MNALTRSLLTVSLVGAGFCLAPSGAFAQRTDSTSTVKPQLNTAPPGTAPRPSTPAPRPSVPVPAPTPEPVPAPRPTSDSPSGLDFPAGSKASEQPKPFRRYFLYSNFGLSFNSIYGFNQFNISAAPALGIRLTERLAVGPGISYSYSSYSTSGPGNSIRTNSFGVKAFAQFTVFDQFFLHGEYEVTKAEVLFQDASGYLFPGKLTVRTPLAGAGYRQQFSDRAAADIVLLYNFNDGINDIYGQPVIRFSFLFDLK